MSNCINVNLKTAIITGSTGFVGLHLTKRLAADNWDVHLIIRQKSNLVSLFKEINKRITFHMHDGTTKKMVNIIKKVKPAIVFHLASLFIAQHQTKDIEPLIKSNVLFGTQLVEAMVINKIYQLINTGTSWQHYDNKDYSPVCLYAATKQAFEDILRLYIETTPLKIITLKLFDTYGPDDQRQKLFSLLKKIGKEQKPLAMSPGEQLMDIVYIDDVLDAFVLASEILQYQVKQYEEYAVSSGKPIKLKELAEMYESVTGISLPIEWGGRPYRTREVMVPWTKGKLLPGWKPKVSIKEGIAKFITS
jgi:nucleoside-diphosphate-sugar epimerase